VALFCVLNTASVVTAQDGLSRAETLNVEAQVQFDRGSYRQALDRWTEVYAAFRNPTTAWNIARCYEELRELDAAKVAYELFLGLEGLSPEEIEAGESRLASIRAWFEDWKGLSDRARARADEGAWTDALPMWERAARLNRTAPTLYGIAQALDGLGRAEDAVVAYRVFIAHPQADPQRVAEAMARIDALLDDARLPLRVAGWSMVGASVVLGWLLWDRAGEEGEGPAIEVQQRPPGDGAPEAEEPPPGSVSTGADQENHSVPEAGPITAKALPTREEPDAGPAAEPREAAAKVAPPVPDASPERTPDSPETAPRPPPRDTPQHGIFVANPFDG